MNLKNGDLKHQLLKKVSIDEFKPKSGSSADVLLVGFYVREQHAAEDLYNFLNFSRLHNRDIEISPNPNDDGYYVVFAEFDRQPGVENLLNQLLGEVERLTGKLQWEVRTHLMDDYLPITDPSLSQYVITMPANYVTRKEFDRQKREEARAERMKQREERNLAKVQQEARDNDVYNLLKDSNLVDVKIRNGQIFLKDSRDSVSLKLVDVGSGKDVMSRHGIAESALSLTYDYSLLRTLNGGMLGTLKTMPINGYILIYNPVNTFAILTQPV